MLAIITAVTSVSFAAKSSVCCPIPNAPCTNSCAARLMISNRLVHADENRALNDRELNF